MILLCTVFVLPGCISSIAIGAAAVTTQTVLDPRTIGTQIDDNILKIKIANVLTKDTYLNQNARIISIVYGNKVFLLGQAPTYKIIKHAVYIVRNVTKNIKIYNEIRLSHVLSFKDILIDFWITTKLYSHILITHIHQFYNVKIYTENKEVFLFGIVTNKEANIIANIASKTYGVKHVITIFSYIHENKK